MILRRFEPGDLPEVRALHHLGLRQAGTHAGPGPWDDDFDDILGAYVRAGGEFLVGVADGRIVAMGALRPTAPGRAEVKRMRVHPDHQRRGYGQRILTALEARAAELGFAELHLDTTLKQDAARALYEKNGWLETARRPWRDTATVLYAKTLRPAPV